MKLQATEEMPPEVNGVRYKRRIKPGICCVYRCQRKARAKMKNAGKSFMCSKHAMERWRRENPMKAAYAQVKESARKREIPFKLSLEEFAGVVSQTEYLNSKGVKACNYHLDRKESDKGYELSNIQVLTAGANCAKVHAQNERRKANKRRASAGQVEWADDATLAVWAAEIGAVIEDGLFGECERCNGAYIWAQTFILHEAKICECCMPQAVNNHREAKAEAEFEAMMSKQAEIEESDWIDDSQFA